MEVRQDTVASAEVRELLQEHLLGMQADTPPGSVHALDLSAYESPKIKLWIARSEGQLLGCGALHDLGKLQGEHTGEIKSMRTKEAFLRRGVANAILKEIILYAKNAGMQRLSLETGATERFSAAHSFYCRHGFVESPPFGSYKPDPHSLFFTITL